MASRTGVAVVAALVAFAAALVFLIQPVNPPYVDAGVPGPPFALPALGQAEPVSLDAQRGRVVLVNFWATWCKPCEDEMPSMQRLYETLGGPKFELLAISVDDAPEPVEAFRQRYGITFPLLLDPAREVSDAWQTYHFPESFLVDGEGQVVERYIGPRTWDAPEYVERIRALMAVLP